MSREVLEVLDLGEGLLYGVHMTNDTTTCTHKFCDTPVIAVFARYKYVEGLGMSPFHTACSHAHPEYDVSKGTGSPFTTITVAAI